MPGNNNRDPRYYGTPAAFFTATSNQPDSTLRPDDYNPYEPKNQPGYKARQTFQTGHAILPGGTQGNFGIGGRNSPGGMGPGDVGSYHVRTDGSVWADRGQGANVGYMDPYSRKIMLFDDQGNQGGAPAPAAPAAPATQTVAQAHHIPYPGTMYSKMSATPWGGGDRFYVGPQGYKWRTEEMNEQLGVGGIDNNLQNWKVDPITGIGQDAMGNQIWIDKEGRVQSVGPGNIQGRPITGMGEGADKFYVGPEGRQFQTAALQNQLGAMGTGDSIQDWQIDPQTGIGYNAMGEPIYVRGGQVYSGRPLSPYADAPDREEMRKRVDAEGNPILYQDPADTERVIANIMKPFEDASLEGNQAFQDQLKKQAEAYQQQVAALQRQYAGDAVAPSEDLQGIVQPGEQAARQKYQEDVAGKVSRAKKVATDLNIDAPFETMRFTLDQASLPVEYNKWGEDIVSGIEDAFAGFPKFQEQAQTEEQKIQKNLQEVTVAEENYRRMFEEASTQGRQDLAQQIQERYAKIQGARQQLEGQLQSISQRSQQVRGWFQNMPPVNQMGNSPQTVMTFLDQLRNWLSQHPFFDANSGRLIFDLG